MWEDKDHDPCRSPEHQEIIVTFVALLIKARPNVILAANTTLRVSSLPLPDEFPRLDSAASRKHARSTISGPEPLFLANFVSISPGSWQVRVLFSRARFGAGGVLRQLVPRGVFQQPNVVGCLADKREDSPHSRTAQ